MNDIDILPDGWCALWCFGCAGVPVECVRADRRIQCTTHWARELGLPAGSSAGAVVAELMRRETVPT